MKFDKSLLKITPASYREAKKLEKSLARALAESSINLNINMKQGKFDIPENTVGELIKSILHLVVSDEVEFSLFQCCERAVYNNKKINEDFFENVENRELYYFIMMEVIKVNAYPFIKGLSSRFEGLVEMGKSFLK